MLFGEAIRNRLCCLILQKVKEKWIVSATSNKRWTPFKVHKKAAIIDGEDCARGRIP